MKLLCAAALVLSTALPTVAAAGPFSIDFEHVWSGENGRIDNFYNGGRAGDPDDTTVGPNFGVTFVHFSGLSNADAAPGFPFYANAPSPVGTAYADDSGAFLNLASGVSNALAFFYSTPSAVIGGIKAYSGLNGTGQLLGTIDLVANDSRVFTDTDGSQYPVYDTFTRGVLQFTGVARSFDFSAGAPVALFDNIATIPEPGVVALLFAGAAVALRVGRRRR